MPEGLGQGAGPGHLFGHRADLIVEADLAQAGHVLVNAELLVLFIEEFSVFQAGNQDPFVPLDHVIQVVAVPIPHGNKVRQELASVIPDAEEALVVTHGSNQDFFRQDEVLFIKGPGKGGWPFHQVVDFFQQFQVFV